MIKNGIQKNPYSLKDYSHERTFGAVDPKIFEAEYNADLAISFPDQNADGLPNACTGYTQSELGQDENGELFDPKFTYEKTLAIANLPPHSPCQIRDSFKSTRTFGLKRKKVDSTLIRGNFYDVDKNGDYFDGARTALYLNRIERRTISCGTPWFPEWRSPQEGILKAPKKYVWDSNTIGHNYKICGWKTIRNEPYLILKPWTGPKWGDNGYAYISREIFNKVMGISGTFMYIQSNLKAGDIKTVKLDIQELILTFLNRMIKLVMPSQDHITEIPLSEKYPKPLMEKESSREKLYRVSKESLGTDLTPDDKIDDSIACVAQFQAVYKKAFGTYLGTGPALYSTKYLVEELRKNPNVVAIPWEDVVYGDVVCFGTGENKYNNAPNIRGHVFVAGKVNWMSNNSQTGLWSAHKTRTQIQDYYVTFCGFPVDKSCFRLRG